jgi:hypothetical protein
VAMASTSQPGTLSWSGTSMTMVCRVKPRPSP